MLLHIAHCISRKLGLRASLSAFIKKLQDGLGRDLALRERARHIFLRGAAGDISRREESLDCRRAVIPDPVAARRVAADDVRLRALNLYIFLGRALTAFKPLERL